MQRINDLCQFLLVANTIEMFMWQIPFPLSIEVASSFLHTGPFLFKIQGASQTGQKQVRNRSETGQKHTIQAILSPLAFQADFSFVTIHIASEVQDIIRAFHFRDPSVREIYRERSQRSRLVLSIGALDWCCETESRTTGLVAA